MIKNLAPALLLAVASSGSVQADPFQFQYTDTTVSANSDFYLMTPPGTVGGPVSVTVTVDNGGSGFASQVWTATDLQSVSFNFGTGKLITTFFTPFGGNGLNDHFGNFETNASGVLTSVPGNWSDNQVTADYVTTGIGDSFSWNLGYYFGYSQTSGALSGGVYVATNPADNQSFMLDPTRWSSVGSVPEPGIALLMLTGIAGILDMPVCAGGR